MGAAGTLHRQGPAPGLPPHGIGRSCKVGKEEIVGLLVALQLFLDEDAEERRGRWLRLMQELAHGLSDIPRAVVSLLDEGEVPQVALDLEPGGPEPLEVMRRLEAATPAVHADPFAVQDGRILFAPPCLKEGEPALIVRQVHATLKTFAGRSA